MNWPRFLIAVFLAEAIPVALLVAVVAALGPSEAAEASAFAESVGAWLGPIAGAVCVFAFSYWVAAASPKPLMAGLWVGVAVAALDGGILVASGVAFEWRYVAANMVRVVAGWVGGRLAAFGAAGRGS